MQRSNTQESAVAVADSCIEILFSNWRAICSKPGNVTTAQTTNDFNGVNGQPAIPLPTSSQLNLPSVTNFAKRGTSFNPANDEYVPNYTISNYKVVAVDAEWNALSSAGATPGTSLGCSDKSPEPYHQAQPPHDSIGLQLRCFGRRDAAGAGTDRQRSSRKSGAYFRSSSFRPGTLPSSMSILWKFIRDHNSP